MRKESVSVKTEEESRANLADFFKLQADLASSFALKAHQPSKTADRLFLASDRLYEFCSSPIKKFNVMPLESGVGGLSVTLFTEDNRKGIVEIYNQPQQKIQVRIFDSDGKRKVAFSYYWWNDAFIFKRVDLGRDGWSEPKPRLRPIVGPEDYGFGELYQRFNDHKRILCLF